MTRRQTEPALADLTRVAGELAHQRGEAITSAHLLAAIAGGRTGAGDLLVERHLDVRTILETARTQGHGPDVPMERVGVKACEIAASLGEQAVSEIHALLAVLRERRSVAHRVVVQRGVDAGRLRAAALNLALGILGRRRVVGRSSPSAAHHGRQRPRPQGTAPWPGPCGRPGTRPAPTKPAGVALSVVPCIPGPPGSEPSARKRTGQPGQALSLVPSPREPSPGSRRDAAAAPIDQPPPAAPAPLRAPPAPRTVPSAGVPSRFDLDPKRFPTLSSLGRNLTLAAARGELDQVRRRSAEVERALDVLAKRQANNPILVGSAGVGKTSVVRAMALRTAEPGHSGSVDDRLIIEVPLAELIAGTGVRGALSARLASVHREVATAQGRVVVFFDEIHQLFVGDGAEEIAPDLKRALARGELPCIGATTREDYQRAIDGDAALARRFTVIEIEEPSPEHALEMLAAASEKLSGHHCVSYPDEALRSAVEWSVRYLSGRSLPDKAVGIADLAGARARRRGLSRAGVELVAEVVAELADMPVERLLETDGERLLRLHEALAERVVGHAHELARIARILRRNAAGFGAGRPLGSFLLLGPTGVGKTETAKAVSQVLFGSESALTRLDMSEYSEPHAVARLIGAPPGYVGHDAGGQLTEAVRRRPYQVILLDEIEKAHRDVLLAFLAVLDEGRLTDGRGRTVDFTNTVILMTSNLGADCSGAERKRGVGFGRAEPPSLHDVRRDVAAAARDALAPELYNRLDEVLVFAALARAEVQEIARRSLARLGRGLERSRGLGLKIGDGVIEVLLAGGGYDPALGARPLSRTIARLVEAPLAERILRGDLARGDTVALTVSAGSIVLETIRGGTGRPVPSRHDTPEAEGRAAY